MIVQKGLADPGRIAVIWFSKLDDILHPGFDAEAFKRKLRLDPEKRTVLYDPTWIDLNRYSSLSRYVIPVMRKLGWCNVIALPHIDILRHTPWQLLKLYIRKTKNCCIFPMSVNVLSFMAVADLMLNDISSVAQEFLAFDRPLIFPHPTPGKNIPEERTCIWQCGVVVENKSER